LDVLGERRISKRWGRRGGEDGKRGVRKGVDGG